MTPYVTGKAYKRMSPEQRADYDMRRDAERHDERMNEPMTRGAILEALDSAMILTENETDVATLRFLKKVFE